MEYDLLLTLVTTENWKKVSTEGALAPELIGSDDFIRCIPDDKIEDYANSSFSSEKELILVVIDPLRVLVPIKHEAADGTSYPLICGRIELDSVIEKIPVLRDNKGSFHIRIKHFD